MFLSADSVFSSKKKACHWTGFNVKCEVLYLTSSPIACISAWYEERTKGPQAA